MLPKILRDMGVVGAGGAGFPTYVKANSKVELVIANGAECEPLIHKDYELMVNFPEEIIHGMKLLMESTGAKSGKFGIKEKNTEAVNSIEKWIQKEKISFTFLGDFYPSGDEFELVYEATGKLIPPAGIPLNVNCVVNNVETLYNVYMASKNIPVTKKLITVTGEINEPKTFWVPIGTSFRECIDFSGGSTKKDFTIVVNGLMMGSIANSENETVTKTTAGLILLPTDHIIVKRKNRNINDMDRIGKSACDQCSYCTELCPRYLLGYEVMPHKVMRSLGFSLAGESNWNEWAELCCSCGLCTLYSCPEDLYPKEACDNSKQQMRQNNIKFTQKKPVKVHPLKESRRVPQSLLRKRLNIEKYNLDAPFINTELIPSTVNIKIKQSVGEMPFIKVKEQQRVKKGDVLAEVEKEKLGATLHSSIDGIIVEINESYIKIQS